MMKVGERRMGISADGKNIRKLAKAAPLFVRS
jgi:hypothetical protein